MKKLFKDLERMRLVLLLCSFYSVFFLLKAASAEQIKQEIRYSCDFNKECVWKAFKTLVINKDGLVRKWYPQDNTIKVGVIDASENVKKEIDFLLKELSSSLPFKIVRTDEKYDMVMVFVDDLKKEGRTVVSAIMKSVYKKEKDNVRIEEFTKKINFEYNLVSGSDQKNGIINFAYIVLEKKAFVGREKEMLVGFISSLGLNNPVSSLCLNSENSDIKNINLSIILNILYDQEISVTMREDEIRRIFDQKYQKMKSTNAVINIFCNVKEF